MFPGYELDELFYGWVEPRLNRDSIDWLNLQPVEFSNPLIARPWSSFYTVRGYHSGLGTILPTLLWAMPRAMLWGPRLTLATGGVPHGAAVLSAAFRHSTNCSPSWEQCSRATL